MFSSLLLQYAGLKKKKDKKKCKTRIHIIEYVVMILLDRFLKDRLFDH